MARFTFGGTIRDLTALPSSNPFPGALTVAAGATLSFYSAATGGSVVSDYLLDNDGDGVFETAAGSIVTRADGYLPSFQGPDSVSVLYYDPDPSDTEVRRVLLIARDANNAGVPDASSTVKGIVLLSSSAGTSTTVAATPAGAAAAVSAHAADLNAHPELVTAVSDVQTALAGKASLNADGVVALDQLPASNGPTGGLLVTRRDGGQGAGTDAVLDDEWVTKGQLRTSIPVLTGVDVRHKEIASGSLPVSASSTTMVDIPTLSLTDAASAQQWRCDYDLCFQGATAGGVKIQFKPPASTATNILANPSFETDVSNWSSNSTGGTPTRNTAQGGAVAASGSANMQISSTPAVAATALIVSEWHPYTAGTAVSAGAYVKRSSATARGCRVDIQFGTADAVDGAISTGVIANTGANSVAVQSSTTYQQAKVENVSTTDATATKVRVRLAVTNTVSGDVHHFDAIQLEPGATTLPAYGNTGGSGAGSLTAYGSFSDPAASPRQGIRGALAAMQLGLLASSADSWTFGSFLVKVGGTNLTSQTIALQFSQATTNATATQLVYGNATFARVA